MHTFLNRWWNGRYNMHIQYKHTNASTYMHTHARHVRENIGPQRWRVVTGGLSDAAAHWGPPGPVHAALWWNTPALALAKGFGQAPHVVSWMVAPSLRSPKVHRWLQWTCAMSKSSTQLSSPRNESQVFSLFSSVLIMFPLDSTRQLLQGVISLLPALLN